MERQASNRMEWRGFRAVVREDRNLNAAHGYFGYVRQNITSSCDARCAALIPLSHSFYTQIVKDVEGAGLGAPDDVSQRWPDHWLRNYWVTDRDLGHGATDMGAEFLRYIDCPL